MEQIQQTRSAAEALHVSVDPTAEQGMFGPGHYKGLLEAREQQALEVTGTARQAQAEEKLKEVRVDGRAERLRDEAASLQHKAVNIDFASVGGNAEQRRNVLDGLSEVRQIAEEGTHMLEAKAAALATELSRTPMEVHEVLDAIVTLNASIDARLSRGPLVQAQSSVGLRMVAEKFVLGPLRRLFGG